MRTIALSIAALALVLSGYPAAPKVTLTAETTALGIINQERAKMGCVPLVMQTQLMAAARTHAKNMAEKNFFSHVGLDGSTFADRIRAQGFRGGYLAENIAAGQRTAAEVVSVWMRSKGHRANILNCRYTVTGIALEQQANDQPVSGHSGAFSTYWVNTFGGT